MDERRLTVRLQKYWDLLKKTSDLPNLAQFNSAAVEDLWPRCFMVQIDPHNSNHFKFDYVGEDMVKVFGQDLTGMVADQRAKQFFGGSIFRGINEVMRTQTPATHDGHLTNEQGKLVKYRACFLPFGNGQQVMTHVLVGLSHRVF